MIKKYARIAVVAVSAAVVGGVALAPGASAAVHPAKPSAATLKRIADQCGVGEICLWANNDYQGTPWRWTVRNGYRDLPPYLHDNVHSFYANSTGCFINWQPSPQFVRVNAGDYSAAYAYDGKFGSVMDAINTYPNCHA